MGFRPICRTRQIKGFLALFPGVKKVRRSRAPRGRNWVRSRAHGRHEVSWLRHGCGSLLVAERQERSWLVLLLLVNPRTQWLEQPLVQAVHGFSHGGLEEFPLLRCLPCRAVRTWKTGHFYFALVSFSLFWRLGVACGVQCIGFFGRSFVHLTWFDSGYMFFEGFGRVYIFSTLR